ncbi:MAG: efflux RND transporter periplasmic adaptor subunit [Cyclobacteriaceae bacterium]
MNQSISQAFAIIILLTSCQSPSEKVSPVLEAISESVYASGIVKSKNQYQVYAASSGLIQDILVKEGDLVKQGDPIMKLVNDASQITTTNSKLAADYAAIDANTDKLKELKVAIDLAASKLLNDSLLAVRQRKLWSQNIGTQVELEQRELAYQNAITNYEVAQIRYNDLKRQLVYNSKQSQNNLKISTSMANDFTVKSDTDGKVYKILKEKGEFVSTLNPVAIVGDATSFYVELTIDEYDIARIKEGQRVLITMDSYKGELFEATVRQIEPLMNEQSRSFTINADFVKRPTLLYPNLSLEANIIINSKENALTIPRNYLIGDSMVLLSNGEKKKVITGLMDYQKAEIVKGLDKKDVLILPQP